MTTVTTQSGDLQEREAAATVIREDLEYICSSARNEFKQLEGSTVLLTGGAGFLGYYLVQSMLHWNSKVQSNQKIRLTVYDNYIRGVPSWLTELSSDPTLAIVKHDITDPLPADIRDYNYIIHAASIASPIYYRKHPIETMDANVNGLRRLLDYAREQLRSAKAMKGILVFSTSEIYGDPDPANIPTAETYRGNVSCTGPRACYDESKRYAETLCVNFSGQYGVPARIARPFNNYGPGLKITDRRVLPDFARDVLNGRDIIMLSDGSPKRTFCYVADAIVGYYKILVRGRNGEAYNIGTDAPEISMRELAERVVTLARELFGYTGRVVLATSQDSQYLIDNPNRRCPVISKARSELGFNPGISLEDGLRRSLIWYSGNRLAEEA